MYECRLKYVSAMLPWISYTNNKRPMDMMSSHCTCNIENANCANLKIIAHSDVAVTNILYLHICCYLWFHDFRQVVLLRLELRFIQWGWTQYIQRHIKFLEESIVLVMQMNKVGFDLCKQWTLYSISSKVMPCQNNYMPLWAFFKLNCCGVVLLCLLSSK